MGSLDKNLSRWPSSSVEQRELLSEGRWFPVGLPPRQTDIDQDFSPTQRSLDLMHKLGRMAAAGESVYLLVGNLEDNVRRELGAEASEEEVFERVRLMGLQQFFFFDALQKFASEHDEAQGIAHECVPIFMASDLINVDGFSGLRKDVELLFDVDRFPDFVEAVYRGVSRGFLPHRHRSKTYKKLAGLKSQRWIKEARARSSYVLSQIALVLFLGGQKMRHQGEHVYDEATTMAQSLLKYVSPGNGLSFFDLVEKSPYSYYEGAEGAVNSDAFSAVRPADLGAAPNELDAALDDLEQQQLALSCRLVDFLNGDPIDGSQVGEVIELGRVYSGIVERSDEMLNAALLYAGLGHLEASRDFARDRHRFRELWMQSFLSYKGFKDGDFLRLLRAFELRESKEALLDAIQPPNYKYRFLFEYSGVTKVIKGENPVVALTEGMDRWFPLRYVSTSCDNESNYLMGAASTLSDYYDAECVSVVAWRIPYQEFEVAIFSDSYLNPNISPRDAFAYRVGKVTGLEDKDRSELLAGFFDLIEGTPVEVIYKFWLDRLCGERCDSFPLEVLDDIPPALASSVLRYLREGVFNGHFITFFEGFLEGC